MYTNPLSRIPSLQVLTGRSHDPSTSSSFKTSPSVRATRRPPHAASRLVNAKPVWFVKTQFKRHICETTVVCLPWFVLSYEFRLLSRYIATNSQLEKGRQADEGIGWQGGQPNLRKAPGSPGIERQEAGAGGWLFVDDNKEAIMTYRAHTLALVDLWIRNLVTILLPISRTRYRAHTTSSTDTTS